MLSTRKAAFVALFLATGITVAARAQEGANPSPADMAAAQAKRDAIPDTAGDGPFPAIMETDPSLPGHVIYRPKDLSAMGGRKLAVLAWGNGGCSDDGASARLHLAEIASYGYLVIAPGEWRSGPQATATRKPFRGAGADGQLPPPATTAADVRAGIDWAIAQNGKSDSPYSGRIAIDQIAVAGHSCGGLQAIELAPDPRVKTVMINNSGIFNNGVQAIAGLHVDKAMLDRFHTPTLYILGGPTDIAYANGVDDFSRIEKVPAILLNLPVGHGGTFFEPMGGAVAHVAVDWLEWQLRGDRSAARTFKGQNCRLCSGTDWTIEKKRID
ncbi:hypothetical protein [Novosphingobium mathurense]|uniref:Chlorophyllase enzyme n=1 Tax=Novosphingobium mathurense TaxID=428990 RepID=A0A1U6IR65_9SPHN|nr:hypothetical protein [Novosphingobium mathurense]SLK10537.1 hypothetical protein SAMN06295987_1129 [Novosphingobium mathurense]